MMGWERVTTASGAQADASNALRWHWVPEGACFGFTSQLPPTMAFASLSVAQQPSFLPWRHSGRGSLAAAGCVTHQLYHP